MTTRDKQLGLAWYLPNLASKKVLTLTSSDFENESTIPTAHAAEQAGGQNTSPALAWSSAPSGTEQLLLVVEDPDAPTATPFIHCVALLEPTLTSLPSGALDAQKPGSGVHVLRSSIGSGYFGPAPPKSHGSHRYVFELFALGTPLIKLSNAALETAKPREVLAAVENVVARGRLDGFYKNA